MTGSLGSRVDQPLHTTLQAARRDFHCMRAITWTLIIGWSRGSLEPGEFRIDEHVMRSGKSQTFFLKTQVRDRVAADFNRLRTS